MRLSLSCLRNHLRRMWPAYLVLLISLAPVTFLYLRTAHGVVARRKARFDTTVQVIAKTADLYLNHYLTVLKGMRGLFAASQVVTPEQFRRYLSSIELRDDHPGLLDLGFAMRVLAKDKETHVQYMQRNGFRDYSPWFLGDEPEHFPLAYLDDFSAQGMIISGWDVYEDPTRRAAMDRARDSGEAVATTLILLHTVNPTNRVPGFLVYLPVYADGITPTTVPERQAKLVGFVFGSFVSETLWADIANKAEPGIVEMQVFDGDKLTPDRRVYPVLVGSQLPPSTRRPRHVDVYTAQGLGRIWTFLYQSQPAFDRSLENLIPLATLLGGLALSGGLSAIAWVLVRARAQAERMTAELRDSEASLRISEAQFRGIFDSIQDLYYRADGKGVVTMISPSCYPILGYRAVEVIGRPATDAYVHPEQRREVVRRLSAEGTLQDYELELRKKSGEMITVSMNAHLVRDEEGRPAGTEGILRDITERKQAEEALRESTELLAAEKERLTVTLRSIGDGVITTDTAGHVVLLNRRAEEITGWRQSEAEGRPLTEVFDVMDERTRERRENPVARVLHTGDVVEATNPSILTARDGTRRWIADSTAPIRDSGGQLIGVVLVFRDVTERQRLEVERLRASKLESVGLLAGGIAHDFNNILTAVIGNLSLARMLTTPSDEIQDRLAEVEQAAARAKDLTQQLLTFAKGGAPVRKAASLAEVIGDSTHFALRGSNVRCEFALPEGLWPVEIDVGQMSQVIHNLVLNAVHAMPEGGCIRAQAENLEVGCASGLPISPGPYVKFTLADTGTGIKPEHLPKIFDPYFTTKQHGSGLGLATTYSIIKKHDGLITVDSILGRGTSIHIYLPAVPGAQVTTVQDRHAPPGGQGRILVMDDEPAIRALLTQILAQLGYEVESVGGGQEVLASYCAAQEAHQPFTAVIMDLTIPGGMGGKETIKLLRALDPKVKAIVSSGYSNDPVMADYRSCGFAGVLAKPYQVDELAQVLHEVLA